MNLETTNDFKHIVINETPLIDVRAPIEFNKGAFINSVNLPIMNNHERHLVGTCYKQKGNEEATQLGYKLVSGSIKQQRVNAWIEQFKKQPETIIYCFRGGQRSRISQEWITKALGRDILRLKGGYKAFRNYLIKALAPGKQTYQPVLLGGHTGSGKTILLKQLDNNIDLEGIANHRGSSFGNHITSQPTQINFENNLAYSLIQYQEKGYKHLVLEDEGRHVGRCFIPKELADFINSGNLVILQVPFDERVNITYDEYILEAQQEYADVFGENEGINVWVDYIHTSLDKIKRRLGGERYKKLIHLFEKACREEIATGNKQTHKRWIEQLLTDYYDPMYEYQLANTTKNVVFKGNTIEVKQYLSELA